MTISSITGRIYYPGGRCNGTLVQAHDARGKLLIRENDPSGPCVGANWSFTASGPNIAALGDIDNLSRIIQVTFSRTS
jgi:hypothetical protein